MSTSLSIAMELLFVRHGDIRRRSEVSQAGKLLKRPFDDFGTTSFDSSDQSTFVLPAPPPELRSLLIGRFPKQEWFSVFSDSDSIDKIVAANNSVGRLQFARLKRDLVGKLVVLEVVSGGKVLGRCEAGAGPRGFTVTGTQEIRASVADCADAESAMKALRESFQLDTALKTVVERSNGYSVIDEKARELNPSVCALLILEGRKSAKKGSIKAPTPIAGANTSDGKRKRKVNLAAALTRLDAEEVRLAIKQGASLRKLTGLKVTPLHYEKLTRDAICGDNGRPLRFERSQNYLRFGGFSDPEFSSRHLTEVTLRDIDNMRPKDDPFFLTSIVRNCFTLLAMQRMQYAGAPEDGTFLHKGCDAGIELFQKLKSTWKKDLSMNFITELGMAMLLCRINEDDSGLTNLCDSVQPRMMTDSLRNPEDPPLGMGQALLAIVSHFRSRAVPKLTDVKQQISQSRCERAKILLRALDSLERSDGRSLATSLRRSVELFVKETDPDPQPNYLISKFAIPESILFDAGRAASLLDDVPDDVADWMITK